MFVMPHLCHFSAGLLAQSLICPGHNIPGMQRCCCTFYYMYQWVDNIGLLLHSNCNHLLAPLSAWSSKQTLDFVWQFYHVPISLQTSEDEPSSNSEFSAVCLWWHIIFSLPGVISIHIKESFLVPFPLGSFRSQSPLPDVNGNKGRETAHWFRVKESK